MVFSTIEDVRKYLVTMYPKSKGKTMASWMTSDMSLAVGVYEGEDMIQGMMIYKDPNRGKWIILDSLHADIAVRSYIEYREGFDEAIALFELLDEMNDEDIEEENDEGLFFTDLD